MLRAAVGIVNVSVIYGSSPLRMGSSCNHASPPQLSYFISYFNFLPYTLFSPNPKNTTQGDPRGGPAMQSQTSPLYLTRVAPVQAAEVVYSLGELFDDIFVIYKFFFFFFPTTGYILNH